jgi:hypothetical protein
MGKNYSRNNASGKRKPSDLYETHYSLTREFLKATNLRWATNLTISDPCAGNGAIIKVLQEEGFQNIISHDIMTDGVDFLQDNTQVDYIFSNPPYSLANEFILHAKEVCHKFAFLLPLTYLQGSYRYNHIWGDQKFSLESVWVFNRFPMLGVSLREDGLFPTGMQAMAWFLWERTYSSEPTIHWLDIDKYILRKGNKDE